MQRPVTLLERGIPDLVSTDDLPESFAAEIDFLAGRSGNRAAAATAPGRLARTLVAQGDLARGREVLRNVDVEALELQDLVAAAWAVSRVGPRELVKPMRSLVAARPDDFLFAGSLPLGPRAATLGVLDAADGRLDDAVATLDQAIVVGDARAPLWGALARLEQARVLRGAAAAGPRASDVHRTAARDAIRALTAARTFFTAGGYRSLLARVDQISDLSAGRETLRPSVGHLAPGSRWRVGLGTEPVGYVRSSKGLVALRHLIDNRDRVVPAVELDAVVKGNDTGPLLDIMARWVLDDPDPLEGSWVDGAAVSQELRETFFDDTVRSRVTKLLRRTIVKLGETHRLVGAHLDAAVRTGHACRYEPTGAVEINWHL